MEAEDVKTEVVRKELSQYALAETSLKEKEDIVWKLHRQFCHCSDEKLKHLIKMLKLVDQILQKCKICMRYKRVSPRPIDGLPLAPDFNHTTALDLITYEANI